MTDLAGESVDSAWERQNPGQPLPTVPVVTIGWEPCRGEEPTPEQWASWAKGGGDGF